ncbi:MAG: FixH family protein [Bacteroidetes bacterium]|nr:FixH family protein [Bacteroidota bacterium]
MNWFHKLMLVLILFIAMLSFMVWRSSKAKLDLVTDNYYEEELKYQDRIEHTANNDDLQEQVNIEKLEDNLIISFPDNISIQEVSGKVNLYFAANKANDKSFDLLLDQNHKQRIDIDNRSGNYTIQISWQYQNKTYFTEKKIFL